MPEIVEGKSSSKERNWALNTLTTSNPDDIHKELLAAEYMTETRGKRRIAAAIPAGEGKYSIVKHDGHTELVYLLELPEIPGPTQREFEIRKEASYIVSVKNPNILQLHSNYCRIIVAQNIVIYRWSKKHDIYIHISNNIKSTLLI